MSDNLAAVWHEVENLIRQNISVIPVRDKDEIINGETYAVKTPYRAWKKYQHEIIDLTELWGQMEEKNTTAIAMVCGAISGNLEVIDFDVKYYPGIDAIVLTAMRDLYPELFERIRRHRTRSGGKHLVYRIADHEVPPNSQLANRPATPEEIELNPRGKKYRCFIETRGTGGLATSPPSLGYVNENNVSIPVITWEERCSLIELCKAYNEYLQEVKPYTPPRSEQNYYDENPFEHYNRAVDPSELLQQFGWTYVRRNGSFLWFTKPGGRKGDVHGGFNLDKRTFKVFTTNADLEGDKSFTPSTLLAHYQFNDDKSRTYQHLVQSGYGRIKPSMERIIARKRAMQGAPMPTNASPEAVTEYNIHIEQLTTAHPFGIYWEPDDENDGKFTISRLSFKEVALGLGFRLYNNDIVQIIDRFIHKRDLRFFFDAMREYIHEEDPNLYEQIYNAAQAFLQKNGAFESTQLDFLPIDQILTDTRTACYKFYQNGYVLINPQGYTLNPYDSVTDKLIWYEKIQQRSFNKCMVLDNFNNDQFNIDDGEPCERGLYTSFLALACDLDNNIDHIMKVIGWLAHDYKDTTTGYIITLVEKCADPKDGGGSGKNLFCQLLEHTTTICTVAAAQKQIHDINLLQSWNGERIFVLSDPKRDFNFETLKEPSSGNATVKKLFKDEQTFKCADLPKFVIPTNFSYDISDGGLKRRIIAVEFTNFFTECGGVDKHFDKMFPQDFSETDWREYDNFICQSIQKWIAGGLKLKPIELAGGGWEKQFTYTYGPLLFNFISENWEEFKKGNWISNSQFTNIFNQYCADNNFKIKPSSIKINAALDEWCKKHDWFMIKTDPKPVGLRQERGRQFSETPF